MKRNAFSTLALTVALAFAATVTVAEPAAPQTAPEYPQGKWQLPVQPEYGVEIVENVKIPMDDGVQLAATVAYPTDLQTGKRAAGKFPVVIEHMPYAQFAVPIGVNPYFAEHGYISVFVRARGTGQSQGEVQFLSEREGLDGKDLVEWAAKLPESDGKVAIQGCSWPGAIAQTDAAYVGKNSPLKAVIASCSGMENMQRQSWLVGGMPSMSFRTFEKLGLNLVGDTPAVRSFFGMMSDSVKNGGDIAYAGGEFWSQRGRTALAEKIVANDVPMMLNAGWNGVVEMGAVRAYNALQNAYAGRDVDLPMTAGQKISPKYQLIMGGWDHGQGLDMGLYLQWLDTWVKGKDTGLQEAKTTMHLFEQGTGKWVNLNGYPEIDATRWQLGADGTLTTESAVKNSSVLRYAQPADNDGKLSYTSAPLKDGVTLSGAISATIYAQSSNQNLVLIAQLFNVAPDGTEQLITRGALAGSQRTLDTAKSWTDNNGVITYPWHTFAKDEALEPNKTYRFDIAMNTRQWGVRPNHRLRFELTTQTPAEFCPQDGVPTKNDPAPCGLNGAQEKTVPGGSYRILYGADTPSALNLPQLAFNAMPAVKAGKLGEPWNEGERRLENRTTTDRSNAAIGNLLPQAAEITYPLVW